MMTHCIDVFLPSELLSLIEEQKTNAVQEADASKQRKARLTIKRKLLELQEVGDEKLALISVINENIEGYARQLDLDKEDMGQFDLAVFSCTKNEKGIFFCSTCVEILDWKLHAQADI